MSDSDQAALLRVRDVADSMHVRVFTVDALYLAPGKWNAQNVQSPYWRMYRNKTDGAFLRLPEGEAWSLPAGNVSFVPAGVRFGCGDDGRGFEHFYVHFDVLGLPLLLRMLFDAPVCVPTNADFEERVGGFADAVANTPTLTLAGQCRAKSLVYEGLARCLDAAPPERLQIVGQRATQMEQIAPALHWIDTHPGEDWSVSLLANLCCMHPDYFARRFKACVGQTPGEYIRERRLYLAAQRLLFTTDSLDVIAQECGFGNRNYLTRIFTRTTGTPPAAYRKSRRV